MSLTVRNVELFIARDQSVDITLFFSQEKCIDLRIKDTVDIRLSQPRICGCSMLLPT